MYPVIVRIGSFEITSFGALVALGFLCGLWVFRRELRARGLPERIENAAIIGAAGGLLGAKLIWVVEFSGDQPVTDLLFSRAGLSWFGGFMGGVGSGIVAIRVMGAPLVRTLAAAAPALAVGHMLGRIGCFLVGDDYGRPSMLPWAVAFPNGLPPTDIPVHPTQLYEAVFLGGLAYWLIRARRRGASDGAVLGQYFLLAGGFRFLLEFIRINEQILFGLTLAQMFAAGLALVGVWLLIRARAGKARIGRASHPPA
ncbi:MAG: prolipoprotein diacylglyceryl transferase [Acidobacteriota bacterium]|nr:prolipoprotein diacylglyceryl transferase [Acidobacteriota bacterium]